MNTVDFSRSFLTFRIDVLKKPPQTVSHKPPFTLNNARIQLDSLCTITEKQTGTKHEFSHGANCKTERVGVEKDIWLEPNADFVPVMSAKKLLIMKTYACMGMEKQVNFYPPQRGVQPDRQVGLVADAYDSLKLDVCRREGDVLETPKDVIDAVYANAAVVGRTELENDRYTAVLEYPIKTINVNERDMIYQTDTGPVVFPDLTREPDDLIAGFELAFSAFNVPTWIEFIVRVPTKVSETVQTNHYSKSVRMDSKNQLIRLR